MILGDIEMRLYYTKQSSKWEETLPIGNGSLGAMIWGGANKERLGLNEESLWSGYYRDKNNYHAYQSLDKVRQMIINGNYVQAEELISDTMLGKIPRIIYHWEIYSSISNIVRIFPIMNAFWTLTILWH